MLAVDVAVGSLLTAVHSETAAVFAGVDFTNVGFHERGLPGWGGVMRSARHWGWRTGVISQQCF